MLPLFNFIQYIREHDISKKLPYWIAIESERLLKVTDSHAQCLSGDISETVQDGDSANVTSEL